MLNIAEINLTSLKKNALSVKKKLPEKTKLCAVVKADAYGHGAEECARALYSVADCFAVASAFAVYYLFPYSDPVVKKALIFVLFSPTSALAPIFCEKLCGEGARAGAVSSATVVLSIIYYFILTAILT